MNPYPSSKSMRSTVVGKISFEKIHEEGGLTHLKDKVYTRTSSFHFRSFKEVIIECKFKVEKGPTLVDSFQHFVIMTLNNGAFMNQRHFSFPITPATYADPGAQSKRIICMPSKFFTFSKHTMILVHWSRFDLLTLYDFNGASVTMACKEPFCERDLNIQPGSQVKYGILDNATLVMVITPGSMPQYRLTKISMII